MASKIWFEIWSRHDADGTGLPQLGSMQLRDVAKVIVPNSLTFGVVTFTQLEQVLKVTLLVLSVVYTVLHITLLWRKLNKGKSTSSEPNTDLS